MIIVTGCGRSGTYYMSMALNQLGFNVGHEEWGLGGQVGFHAAVGLRGAKISKPWRSQPEHNDVVLHQVRNPVDVISSVQTMQDYSWDFVCRHIPANLSDPVILRCMKYWYYWNLMAESHACYTYQMEKIDESWPTICRLIGLDPKTKRPAETHKGWHKRGHSKLTWDDLWKESKNLTKKIQWLAKHYGYEVD